MQPYFFPYLGYFQLIKNTDLFIVFDDVQYIRHGWVNRNRILKPEKDWQYVIAPLKDHEQFKLIKDIKVQDNDDWKIKILRQIEHYKKRSPFYKETRQIIEECFDSDYNNSLTKFNALALQKICKHINLPLNLKISSEEFYDYSKVNDSGEWALRICEQIGAKTYINPLGGKDLFAPKKFEQSNIELCFLTQGDISYSQRRNGIIESGLSIIDVLMFNSTEQIHQLLNKCEIQTAQ